MCVVYYVKYHTRSWVNGITVRPFFLNPIFEMKSVLQILLTEDVIGVHGTLSLRGAICERTADVSFPLSGGLGDCIGFKKAAMPPRDNDSIVICVTAGKRSFLPGY